MRAPVVMIAMVVLAAVITLDVSGSPQQLHPQQWLQQRQEQLEQQPLQALHRMKRWRFWPFSKNDDAEVVTTTPEPTTTTTTTTTAAPREIGAVERTVGGFWGTMFPITSIIKRNYQRLKNSTVGRAIRNSTVGRAFRRGRNATRRGVVFISRKVSSGARRVGQAVKRGYRKIRRRLTGEQKYHHFIDKVKEGVENGDENTLSMLDRLGINVGVDESGSAFTSVKNNTPTFTEILEKEGLLNRNGSNVPISTPVPESSHGLHDTALEDPLPGESATGNEIESGTSNEPVPSTDDVSEESEETGETEESDEEEVFHDAEDKFEDDESDEEISTTRVTPVSPTVSPAHAASPTTENITPPPVYTASPTPENVTLLPYFTSSPTPENVTLLPYFTSSPTPENVTLPSYFTSSPTTEDVTLPRSPTPFPLSITTEFYYPFVNVGLENTVNSNESVTDETATTAPGRSVSPSTSSSSQPSSSNTTDFKPLFANNTALPDLGGNTALPGIDGNTALPDLDGNTTLPGIDGNSSSELGLSPTDPARPESLVLPDLILTTEKMFLSDTTTDGLTTTTTTTTPPPTTTTTTTPPTTTTTTSSPTTTTTTSSSTTTTTTSSPTTITTTTPPPTTITTTTPLPTTTSITTTPAPTTTPGAYDEFPPPGGYEEDAEFPSPFGPPGGELPVDEDGFPDVFSDSLVRDRLRDIYERGDFSHDDLKNAFNFNPHDYHYYYDYDYE